MGGRALSRQQTKCGNCLGESTLIIFISDLTHFDFFLATGGVIVTAHHPLPTPGNTARLWAQYLVHAGS
jgi:hypothetical protein